MSFEKPQEDSMIGKEEAHELANMISARLNVSPETGELGPARATSRTFKDMEKAGSDWKPTPAEYQKAFEEVDQLMKMVEEDPERREVASAAIKMAVHLPEVALRLYGILNKKLDAATTRLFREEWNKQAHEEIETLKARLARFTEGMKPAGRRLEELEEKGEEFGRAQLESEKKSGEQ